MTDEQLQTEETEPTGEEQEIELRNVVSAYFHPLGGIGLNVFGSDGVQTTMRFTSLEQLWALQGNLTAMAGVLVQAHLAQQMQAQQEAQALQHEVNSKLIMPKGRR